jgi:hypothetical protein
MNANYRINLKLFNNITGTYIQHVINSLTV